MTECQTDSMYSRGDDGIFVPSTPVQHRMDEYDEQSFDALMAMQRTHFWYRGRHRFLLHSLSRSVRSQPPGWNAIDIGGGCGGWIRYLAEKRPEWADHLALADSSLVALRKAGTVLPGQVDRYQVDVMDLGWSSCWDVAFMLDVIEHIPDDVAALRQAATALKPNGLLFVTAPALPQFWSYNDELALHLRRYSRRDFAELARRTGLTLCDARYFMFFLSPLYWLARRGPGIQGMSAERKRELFVRSHKVPPTPVNGPLSLAFSAETPLGHMVRFPWGTSVLGVFRKERQ